MKEYLGLGVVFSAVDKGLAKSLKLTSQGLGEVDDKMKKTGETAENKGKKGGILNGLYDGLKLLSLSQIGSTLNDMQEAMSGVGGGIEDTFKKLDTLSTKVALTFDGKQAQNLNSSLLTTMKTMGLTGDETEIFAQSFMEFGRSVDEATASLPTMGKLVGIMGLDAQKVAQMYGQGLATLRATPDALTGVMKEVVAIQKAYKLTDQISQLPEIFEAVTKNSAMFGKVNAQTALNTVRSISGLSAVFQKVGMSQQGALSAAKGFGDKLASLKRSVSDMRAGLEPLDNDLFDAAQSLTLMGFSGEEAFQKIFEGADNPLKLAEELNGQFSKLSQDQQNIVSARFRRIFGDEATNLLSAYGDEAKKAFDIGKGPEVKKAPDKIFDEYTKGLTNTVAVQEKLTESSKAYFEIMTSFVNKDKTIEVLQAQRKAWDGLTSAVTDADSIFGMFLAKLDLFKKTGLGGFILELAPIGVMAGLLGSLIFPLANLVGIFKIFGKLPLKVIGGFFKGLSSVLGTTGLGFKALLKPVMLFKTIAEHLYVSIGVRMIDAFAKLQKGLALLMRIGIGPLMTAFRSLAMVIAVTPIGWVTGLVIGLGAALAGIIYYWDDIKKAATDLFNYLGPKIAEMADGLASWLGLDEVWNKMKTGFADVVKYFSELWKGFTKWVSDSMSLGGIGKVLSKVFGFGSDENKTQTAPSPASLAATEQSNVIPLKQQPGVTALPTYTSFADQKPEQVSDPNIQALLNEISKLGQFISQMGQAISDRPVQVSIEGDVKKFFKAVNQEQKNQVGQRMAGGAF